MASPIITTPLILPSGTVGIPYNTNIVINPRGDTNRPYTLIVTLLGLPPGLQNELFGKSISYTPDDTGVVIGETIISNTGARAVIFNEIGALNVGILSGTFNAGDTITGETSGQTGTINSVDPPAGQYARMLLPVLIPNNLYDDLTWTIYGTPTTPGTFHFSFRLVNIVEQSISFGGFSITINAAPVPPTPSTGKKRGGVGGYVRYPDEIIFRSGVQYSQVQYYRRLYNLYIVDDAGFLHYINTSSNISNRGGRNWWAVSL